MLGTQQLGTFELGTFETGTYAFGQAQVTILQPSPRQYGQAQACVKGNAFGQAQAFINKSKGLGQSQARIKQTYRAHSQAQAYLLGKAYGQAQARIFAFDYPRHGQAQARIKQTYQSYAQAQTFIRPLVGLGQANADILATTNRFGQAQAKIKAIGVNKSAQAQAFIYGQFFSYGQARPLIASPYRTLILASNPLAYWRMGDSASPLVDIVGGLNATITGAPTLNSVGALWNDNDGSVAFSGSGQYATTSSNTFTFSNTLTIEAWVRPTSAIRETIYGVNNATGQPQLEIGASQEVSAIINGTFIATSVTGVVTLNQWNHIVYTRSGAGATHKIYVNNVLRSLTTNSATGYTDAASTKMIAARTTSTQLFAGRIDELAIYDIALSVADISAHYWAGKEHPFGQAQASIFTATNAFGQAQATILTFDVNRFAQAQADILQTYNGFAQAQAFISTDTFGFGQAQAFIDKSKGLGQAQAFILKRKGHGQAQADIKQVYQGYSQAQVDIKAIGRGFSQAQAYISAVDVEGFGQAQADILQSYQKYAQSQVDILQTYNGFGQAQALFIYLRQVTGQAQASLSIQVNRFGQAQGSIKAVVNKFAQATALIDSPIKVYSGNSQAYILKSASYGQAAAQIIQLKGWAQAQAQIKNLRIEGWGQAQAWILNRKKQGQAQARIKSISRGFGQAQAFINKSRGEGQAQAQIISFRTQGYGQARALINFLAYGQAKTSIKQEGINKFAQANARIKLVGQKGYGQAQAQVILKVRAYGQAKAQMLATPNRFAQAQAHIIGNTGYGQAQGFIDNGSPIIEDMFGDAQTYIFNQGLITTAFVDFFTYGNEPTDPDPVYSGGTPSDGSWTDNFDDGANPAPDGWFYFTLPNASIVHFDTYQMLDNEHDTVIGIYTGTSVPGAWVLIAGNDDSDIIDTYESEIEMLLPAGTYLFQIGFYGYVIPDGFSINTALLNISVMPPQGYGQAQANIIGGGITNYLVDTFTRSRSIGTGLGTPDIGPAWTFATGTGEPVSVDGSKMVFNNNVTSDGDPSYGYANPRSDLNLINSEFYGEFSLGDTANYVEFDARLAGVDFIYVYVDSAGTWTLYSTTSAGAASTGSFILTADVMYAVKFNLQGTTANFKVWELANPEPGSWLITRTDAAFPITAGDFSMYTDNSAGLAATFNYFDNFNVYQIVLVPRGFGQAQAFILSPTKVKQGQAQAKINATGSKHGLAMARIRLEEVDFTDHAIFNTSNAYQLSVMEYQPEAYYTLGEPFLPGGGISSAPYLQSNMLYKDTAWDNVGLYDLTRQWGFIGYGPYGGDTIGEYGEVTSPYFLQLTTPDDFTPFFSLPTGIPGAADNGILSSDQAHAGFNFLHRFGLSTPLSSNGGWGIEFWYRPLQTPAVAFDNIVLVGNTERPNTGAISINYKDQHLIVEFSNGVGLVSSPPSTTTLVAGELYHVVYRSAANTAHYLYINGQLDMSWGSLSGTQVSTVRIHADISSDHLVFVLDELAFYDYNIPEGMALIHYFAGMNFRAGLGHANAYILGPQGYGQAAASIFNPWGIGNAAARITQTPRKYAQAQAYIKGYNTGQAQAFITKHSNGYSQAAGRISKRLAGYGQAKASIRTTKPTGQAQARITQTSTGGIGGEGTTNPEATYLVMYNGYQLPGYAQEESIDSVERIKSFQSPYRDISFSEYQGLENKSLSLRMLVVGENYLDCKNQVQLAGTLVRSKKDFTPLYVQYTDRHYEVLTKSIKLQASTANIKTAEYSVEFEAKPWLVSDTTNTVTGVSTVGRTIDNGGWTPATITFTGTNVTVSGYSDTESFTGFISVSGTVTNYTYPYEELYIGPGVTHFVVTGATDYVITYNDRWYL